MTSTGNHFKSDHSFCTVTEQEFQLPEVGEYRVLSLDEACPVAIITLGNAELADALAERKPKGMCIVGKMETENVGVEKVIKNTIATPSLRYIILCGKDVEGHFSGDTLLSLMEHGVDPDRKVIGSKGRRPVLANTSVEEVEHFRRQVEVKNRMGCEDIHEILKELEQLYKQYKIEARRKRAQKGLALKSAPVIVAEEKDPHPIQLDKAGYFVIVPNPVSGEIAVEHYDYQNKLLRLIKGTDASNIYRTIIEHGWVSELSHAAYLGKELTRAELSIVQKTKYIQDKS